MSLFSTLSVSQSGLSAASTQLQVTANNVSNAGRDGFTRKSAILSSASLGEVGGGVQVTGFARASNDTLYKTLTKATSNAGLRTTQDDYLQRVQDIWGTSSSDNPTISANVAAFVNSWTSYAASPESTVAERQVLQNATNLTDEIKRISEEVESLDRDCYKDINATLEDLNSYLVQIRDLNQKISQAVTDNQSPGDLQDSRDQLVLKISEITSCTILERDNGQIAVYTATGYQLVDGTSARSFSYDGTDVTADSNPGLSLNTAIVGGKLEGLLNFRDTSAAAAASTEPGTGVIRKLRDQLDAITNAFLTTVTTATSGADTFAAAYNNATTGAGELAANFFTGTNRTNIAVNAALIAGTSTLKAACGNAVVTSLMDSTRVFSASGLSTTGSNYATLVTASITGFQQAASNISTLKASAETQHDYLEQRITNETNVNVDTEMINLVTLQNVYSANARVLSVVQDLFGVLQSLLI